MQSELAAYQAGGQRVTLALGLYDPPSWVFSLANSSYIDQTGAKATEANFVFSQAVRSAAAQFLSLVNAQMPMSDFWAVRLTSGGDGEMLYPGGGTYWAFDNAALTGTGLAAGMTRNPDPNWRPGQPGLTQAQIKSWVSWYVGGLDNVTSWQMQTLSSLGFTGYYETVTPGSGTRPDGLTQTEQQNLPNDGTTGVGAVWDMYYSQLPAKTNVMAYISSVADNSGGNNSCQAADTSAIPDLRHDGLLVFCPVDHPDRGRQNGLAVGGENPGYGMPASLNSFYTNTTATGMMATALNLARSCGFTVFYWAHDIHLWDGTIPFSPPTPPCIGSPCSRPGQPGADRHHHGQQHPVRIPRQRRQRRQPGQLLAGSRQHRRPHPAPNPGHPHRQGRPGTPPGLGHPEPGHPDRRQRQRPHLDHPDPLGDLPVHRGQQRHHHPRPRRHPDLPPPRHQRQQHPGRTPDRRVPGILQLATHPGRQPHPTYTTMIGHLICPSLSALPRHPVRGGRSHVRLPEAVAAHAERE